MTSNSYHCHREHHFLINMIRQNNEIWTVKSVLTVIDVASNLVRREFRPHRKCLSHLLWWKLLRHIRRSSKCKSVAVIGRPITKIQPFMVWNYEHQSIFREKTTKWWPTDNKNPYLTAIITSKRNSTVEFEAKDQLRWWPWSPRRHQPKRKKAKGVASVDDDDDVEVCVLDDNSIVLPFSLVVVIIFQLQIDVDDKKFNWLYHNKTVLTLLALL